MKVHLTIISEGETKEQLNEIAVQLKQYAEGLIEATEEIKPKPDYSNETVKLAAASLKAA